MDLLLLSISCICNSVAIILVLVLHFRENRRGKGLSLRDLRQADALHRYYEKVVNSSNPFDRLKTDSHD